MKNAIILHGAGSSPDDFWLPWLSQELERAGFQIWAPELPQKERPDLAVWTPFVLEHGKFTPETVMIGHSSGCPTILDVLQKINLRIRRALLVAGFAIPLPEMQPDHPMLLKNPDWERMKQNCDDLAFIQSDNDPWGCLPPQGEYMRQKLGGTLIVMTNQGHFGSNGFNQPYPAFPLLRDLCLS